MSDVSMQRKQAASGWRQRLARAGRLRRFLATARLPRLWTAFAGDRRGTTVVTYALVLPLILLLVFGGATVWRVISIKQSMDLATYTAARHLSREGRNLGNPSSYDPYIWEQDAHRMIDDFVRTQVRRNPFVGEEDGIQIAIIPPVETDCLWYARQDDARALSNIRFTIETVVTLRSPLQIPFLGRDAEPALFNFTLAERHSDHVECPRFRFPPEEGDIF